MRELAADVIALQEVVSIDGQNEQDQARFIAAELGFHYWLGETAAFMVELTVTSC